MPDPDNRLGTPTSWAIKLLIAKPKDTGKSCGLLVLSLTEWLCEFVAEVILRDTKFEKISGDKWFFGWA